MAQTGHGLILGKFMPPHAGHQYLVEFGLNFVERLTVLVCSIEREPIPGALRYTWMRELFPRARVIHITDELPQEPGEHPRFWELWRETILHAAGQPIDFVFASEDYGHRLAEEVGAKIIPVDLARHEVPVSATAIRQEALAHWQYLPPCVRPYYVRRVCLFGPESTGKSTLARALAARFRTVHVPEFARELLCAKQGVCDPGDIPLIARGQQAAEEALSRQANRVLFCDTDLLLTTIWSEMLFGQCPEWIRGWALGRHYDLYLLLDIDLPWIDEQRHFPHLRAEFFQRCRAALETHQRPYRILSGSWQKRFTQAVAAVEALLGDDSSGTA